MYAISIDSGGTKVVGAVVDARWQHSDQKAVRYRNGMEIL